MSKQSRWLETESERWVSERIITPDQAMRIRQRYVVPPSTVSWGLVVFFGLGAVIVGLGVILLIAYNWAAIPKLGKLALIFAPLIAAHSAGFALRRSGDWRRSLGEAISLFGTMLFGAGIWLVAQIYNIDEHYPTGFLLWAVGALTLAWALESLPQAILATVLLAIWGGAETVEFSNRVDLSSLILVVTVAPLAWRWRSGILTAVLVPALYVLLLCSAGHWGGTAAAFGNAIALSVLLVGLEKYLHGAAGAAQALKAMRFLGVLGFVVCAYLLGFHHVADDFEAWPSDSANLMAQVYRWSVSLAALAVWIALVRARRTNLGTSPRLEEWLYPIGLVYAQIVVSRGERANAPLISGVFNVIAVALATAWMVRGCRRTALALVVRGSVLLAAVVFARYFDLFDSLAARGTVFVGFGAILFAEGFFYRRLRALPPEEDEP